MIGVRTPSLITNTLPLPDVSLMRISLPGTEHHEARAHAREIHEFLDDKSRRRGQRGAFGLGDDRRVVARRRRRQRAQEDPSNSPVCDRAGPKREWQWPRWQSA
jgi:hypothetical protein